MSRRKYTSAAPQDHRMFWIDSDPAFVHETHFTDRVVCCYRDRPSTIGEMFTTVVTVHSQAAAIVDGDTRLSYRELDSRAKVMDHSAKEYFNSRDHLIVGLRGLAKLSLRSQLLIQGGTGAT